MLCGSLSDVIALAASLCVMCGVTETKRILLLPYQMRSHMSELDTIGGELVERGHEVYSLATESFPDFDKWQSRTKVKYLQWHGNDPDMFVSFKEEDVTEEWMQNLIEIPFTEDLVFNTDPVFPSMAFCSNPLGDQDLFKKLSRMQFDFAIVDGFILSRCYYILPYRLGIPYASLTTQYEPWVTRNPALPSFVPFPVATGDYGYTEKMSFAQRLYNLYSLVKYTVYTTGQVNVLSDELVRLYAPEKPYLTLNDLARKSLVWLFDTDHVIDYARPALPNMIEIGGLTTKPAKLPLNSPFHEFLEDAEHGAIVVSFGSFGANLPKKINSQMMEAFRRIPQKVVWKFSGSPPADRPENILFMPWIPQNDILGHPKVKLFITHCGANGQFEGLYHGVPMLAMPIFGDQPYNARRASYKGIGLQLSLLNFTADELEQTIKEIIVNPKYTEKVRHLSVIYRSRHEKPAERAANWVEHVMEFGGEHMHSYGIDMPWYQYLMLDVLAFLLLLLFAISVVTSLAIRYMCRLVNKDQAKLKQN